MKLWNYITNCSYYFMIKLIQIFGRDFAHATKVVKYCIMPLSRSCYVCSLINFNVFSSLQSGINKDHISLLIEHFNYF